MGMAPDLRVMLADGKGNLHCDDRGNDPKFQTRRAAERWIEKQTVVAGTRFAIVKVVSVVEITETPRQVIDRGLREVVPDLVKAPAEA